MRQLFAPGNVNDMPAVMNADDDAGVLREGVCQ